MDVIEVIYEELRQIREDTKSIRSTTDKNSVVLEEHARRSTASENRLELLERYSIKWNWKLIGIIVGIVSGSCGAAYYVMRILGM